MNPMKKKRFLALTLSVTALFSCSLTPNAYASQIKQGQLVMKLSRTSLISGSDFFDGLGVSLTSSGVDVSADKATTYSISKNGKNYQAGEILTEVGTYQASASYGEDTVSLSFQVTAGNPVTASEGVGYRTLSAESVEKYRVGNFNYIGALGNGKTPSTGHSKLLVIPVGFADTAAFTSEELYKIQQAYFGAANTTGWQSLASFYETSSYGQLHFEGQLVKPFTYSMDSLSFENAYNASSAALAALIDKAVSYAYQQGVSPKDFDDNGDGFIDGLEIVYKTTRPNYRETKEDTSKIWWCFTTTLGTTASVDSPKANRFFWSLYSFIENGYYSPDIDTHTLVHESGHMLGLNDYYSYDREGLSPYEYPLGGADMMDMNVGDHNAYSKFLLGWVRPKYIDGSASDFTLTLNSFAESGDCLILKDTKSDPWNLTPYDEYLMLQYYTPTSLNAADSNGYAEWLSEEYKGKTGHAGTYAQPG